jgi:hypothetical protein
MKALAAQTDTYVGMDLVNPRVDFVSVARGFGLTAHRASKLAEVQELLADALRADGPTLIDVEVDRSWKPERVQAVMAGLDPAICRAAGAWMAGSSPAMTVLAQAGVQLIQCGRART